MKMVISLTLETSYWRTENHSNKTRNMFRNLLVKNPL